MEHYNKSAESLKTAKSLEREILLEENFSGQDLHRAEKENGVFIEFTAVKLGQVFCQKSNY
jgi:hypothetical protein